MDQVKIIGVENGTLTVALSGDIDLSNADAFYEVIKSAYEQQKANVTFDCSALDFIDSTTLGTFVKILKALKTDGFSMRLVGLQPKIKKLFLICSLDTVIQLD